MALFRKLDALALIVQIDGRSRDVLERAFQWALFSLGAGGSGMLARGAMIDLDARAPGGLFADRPDRELVMEGIRDLMAMPGRP